MYIKKHVQKRTVKVHPVLFLESYSSTWTNFANTCEIHLTSQRSNVYQKPEIACYLNVYSRKS